MKKNDNLAARIVEDLRSVGVKGYGLMKAETRELARILGPEETIYGCIYGQYGGGSGMMVATDRRVLFLDKKPMHLLLEEMTFDKIMDIGADWQPFFSKVIVNTRGGRYIFSYVNTKCARTFVHYLEAAVLGMPDARFTRDSKDSHYAMKRQARFDDEESQFLATHAICTVSSIGRNGYPYGATMFYFVDQKEHTIRIVTRSETETAQNLRASRRVALTITDEKMLATMHVRGDAVIDDEPEKGYEIMQEIMKGDLMPVKNALPPVAQLKEGAYVVFKIVIAATYVHTYKKSPPK